MLHRRDENLLIQTGRMLRPPSARMVDEVVQLRPGAYVLDSTWNGLFAEERLLLRARAVWDALHNEERTLTHVTAAALHRLPLYRVRSDRADVALPATSRRHNGNGLRRHHVPLPNADVTVVDGMRVTTLERTVYDVIRSVSLEAAVVVFDAALRLVAWDNDVNVYDLGAAELFRSRVRARVNAHPGARGIRQARFVCDFADGRAGSAAESVSRLWMWQLGVPTPELQWRVELPSGHYALLDFAWPALQKWGECDGRIKYTDPLMLAGRTSEQVIAEQVARQTAVERATRWTCDRWGSPELGTIAEFARFLRSVGLLPGRTA